MHIREKPPLRTSTVLVTPSGRRYRWAKDGPAEATEGSKEWSSTMPGGWDQSSMVLPRDPAVDYDDLVRLSTLQILDASGSSVGEYRLERTPRTSGDQMAITPNAVGWQANLDDNQYAAAIFLDADISHWGPDTQARRIALINASWRLTDPVIADGGLHLEHYLAGGASPVSEAMYDAQDAYAAGIRYAFTVTSAPTSDAAWAIVVMTCNEDQSTQNASSDLHPGGTPQSGTFTASARAKFAAAYFAYNGTASASPDVPRTVDFSDLAVIGDHGLTVNSIGLLGSDMVRFVISRFCDKLAYTSDSIVASSFSIPHCEFRKATTPSAMVKEITKYDLQDWAVWDRRIFWWHPRDYYGRVWKARVGPSRLVETGPQVDRLWNSVVVEYQDVGGDTRTVGPVGSGTNTEDASLTVTDASNPANRAGVIRRAKLSMGTTTSAGAIKVGSRFLAEQALLDSSGQATLDGFVEDEHGILHPYHHVRAGDRIHFTDANDTSARRVVKVSNNEGSRSCTVDLDAPPEGLQATLERLGVVLVPLGV